MRQLAWCATAAAGAAFLIGCGSDDEGPACKPGNYPPPPEGAAQVLHVSPNCSGSGTASAPFGTLSQAIAAASAGTAIVASPGTYSENLRIEKSGIAIIGSADPTDPAKAGIILQAPAENAVVVTSGAADVTLRGLRVLSPIATGIFVHGAGTAATIEGCHVEGAASTAQQKFGFGVITKDAAGIILQNNRISGSAMVGVLLSDAHGIILQNEVDGNLAGGIRVEGGLGSVGPGSACKTAESHACIAGNTLTDNLEMGIGVFGANVDVLDNDVIDTAMGGIGADGIVVAPVLNGSADFAVHVEANEVIGSARAGILVSQAARGIILQNIVKDGGNVGKAIFGAGIWVQAGAGADELRLEGNTVSGNSHVGIGLTSGARGIILQNTVSDTKEGLFQSGGPGIVPIGDGIGVFDSAWADISGTTVSNSFRAGVITDGADGSTSFGAGNSFTGNEYGIILQNNADIDDTGLDAQATGNAVGQVEIASGTQFPVDTKDIGVPEQ